MKETQEIWVWSLRREDSLEEEVATHSSILFYFFIFIFISWKLITLQYSCLENPMDRGAWWATIHGVPRSWAWLSIWHMKWRESAPKPVPLITVLDCPMCRCGSYRFRSLLYPSCWKYCLYLCALENKWMMVTVLSLLPLLASLHNGSTISVKWILEAKSNAFWCK